MRPPNISTPPPQTSKDPTQLQQASSAEVATAAAAHNAIPLVTTTNQPPSVTTNLIQPIITKPTTPALVATSQVQQAPLALTTQPQNQPQVVATTTTATQLQQPQTTTTTTANQSQPQLIQSINSISIKPLQQSAQSMQAISTSTTSTTINTNTTTTSTTTTTTPNAATHQAITLANAPGIGSATVTTTGSTALVIIPTQHPTTSSATIINSAAKGALISNTSKSIPTTTVCVTNAHHVTLAATAAAGTASTTVTPTPIQLQAQSITNQIHSMTSVPMTAHQQQLTTTIVPPTLINRPPSSLPIIPITSTIVPSTTTTPSAHHAPNIKSEPNKYICCLLDNGVRCERIAGNASFSARIQKIVGTKKMNFTLDPTVRHAYICEQHKAIITVAKKSTLARDTKANAKNYTANNNALAAAAAAAATANNNNNNFVDLSRQHTLQHPVNLELITNQNRLANNHTGGAATLNAIPMRAGGPQIAYGHYQGTPGLNNQVGPIDVMMSSSFDNTGGDNVMPPSRSGVDVDLQQLQVNTLRRYKRHFRVQTRPGLNKMQLAESLKDHFRTLPIIEKEAITYFVYIVKCYRNKLDHNPKAD